MTATTPTLAPQHARAVPRRPLPPPPPRSADHQVAAIPRRPAPPLPQKPVELEQLEPQAAVKAMPSRRPPQPPELHSQASAARPRRGPPPPVPPRKHLSGVKAVRGPTVGLQPLIPQDSVELPPPPPPLPMAQDLQRAGQRLLRKSDSAVQGKSIAGSHSGHPSKVGLGRTVQPMNAIWVALNARRAGSRGGRFRPFIYLQYDHMGMI